MSNNPSLSININSATKNELMTVKGIGTSLAQRIIRRRPFTSLNDLLEVKGINATKLASLLPFLTLTQGNPKTTTEPTYQADSLGRTEAFVFLNDRDQREDILWILVGGFLLGLLILYLRKSD